MNIVIKDLRVSFESGAGPLTVLDIPSWQVDKGEQVVISGPSGTGKSTLLNILAGILLPGSGSVRVCDKEITSMPEAQRDNFRALHIGYVFQSFNLLQGYTALENVLVGMTFSPVRPDRATAYSLLKELGLEKRAGHYPAHLSIGEQQRVAIARVLAKKPDLILADEPTGSLDPRHREEVIDALVRSASGQGCSLVVVSHEESVAAHFERKVDFLRLNRAFSEEGGERA